MDESKKFKLVKKLSNVDRVDANETFEGMADLEEGAEFWIAKEPHPYGPGQHQFYTIFFAGRHYNVLANLLKPAMEQVDPPLPR